MSQLTLISGIICLALGAFLILRSDIVVSIQMCIRDRYHTHMGLFPSANDFKAGKGVEKDAPRKTGVGRFFELVGRDMNGMFLANLLACIGFLVQQERKTL